MENNKLTSIEKLDKQIEMLQTRDFRDKTRVIKTKPVRTKRKVIEEEVTDMFSDLIGDNEDTKVIGKVHEDKNIEILDNIKNKGIDVVNNIKKSVDDNYNEYINASEEVKVKEFLLPGILIILIILFTIFCFFI